MLKRKKLLVPIVLFILSLFLFENASYAQTGSIKYVFIIDYPMGGKADYLDWVKSIAAALQKPEELVSLASYDNYFNETPERVTEFEFANNIDAAKYFENPEIKKILEQVLDYGITKGAFVLSKRADYNPVDGKRNNIKYVFTLDYGVGNKAAYLKPLKDVVKILQTPKEVKRITSYDNYLNVSPNRVIEYEFESVENAIKYFELPEIKEVVDKSIDKSVNHKLSVLKLRGDYNKN